VPVTAERFVLEIENWLEWERVHSFHSMDRAIRYGKERFPQNAWRVNDNSRIVYEHDPFEAIHAEAGAELRRFEETERWARHFAEKRADDIRRRQEQERLAEISARRNHQQMARDRQRWERLHSDILSDQWWDNNAVHNPAAERVNWLKEGF
jgi:hypothetical protein